MPRVTMGVGVSSQIPTLTGQLTQLKTAASSFVETMKNKSVAVGSIAQAQQARAQAGATASVANIGAVTKAYHDGVTKAAIASRDFMAQTQRNISVGFQTQGLMPGQERQMRETAVLAGAGQSQFQEAQANLKSALDGAEFIDRLAEMQLQRAGVMLMYAKQSTGYAQEQTGLLKSQQTLNFAILAAANGILEKRKAEFEITKQIGTLAGNDPRFQRAAGRVQQLETEKAELQALLGLDTERAAAIMAEDISMSSKIKRLSDAVSMTGLEYRGRLSVLNNLQRELEVQREIQQRSVEHAAELYVINEALKKGEQSLEGWRQIALGFEDALVATGHKLRMTNDDIVAGYRARGEALEKERRQQEQLLQRHQAQATTFARQPFMGGLGRMPTDPMALELERQALGLMQGKVTLTTEDGVVTRRLSEEEARLMVARAASTDALKRYNQEYQIANGLMRRNRAQLINNSIGMFVLSITITQTVAALEQIVKSIADANEQARFLFWSAKDAAKFLNEMNQVIRMSIGPIQVYTAVMQLASQANMAFFLTALPMLGLFGSLGLLVKAFTAESRSMRKVFSVLALVFSGAATGLAIYNMQQHIASFRANEAAIAQANLAIATNAETIATIGSASAKGAGIIASRGLTSAMGAEEAQTMGLTMAKVAEFTVESSLITLKTFGLGAALVLSVIAFIASIYATMKAFTSFETEPGEYKTVGKTGMATVHEGEIITTPARIGSQGMFGDSGGEARLVIVNNVAGNLDTSVPRIMARRYKAGQIGGVRY